MRPDEFLGGVAGGSLVTTPAIHMSPRSDGLEIVWGVSRLARGWVEWEGEDGSSGKVDVNAFGFLPQGDAIIRVRLEGFKPGAAYRLRNVTESCDMPRVREEGPWKKFRTLNPQAGSTKFAVWNDTHQIEKEIRQLQNITPQGDFLLWNGDICSDCEDKDMFASALLSPAGQDVSAGHPVFVLWGNHDSRGKWAFKMPDFVATPNDRPFYAFRSGPVAVLCLHTGEDKPDDHPSFEGRVAFTQLRARQAEWLKDLIQRPGFRDAPYRVVICHIPLRWKEEGPVDYERGYWDLYSRSSREAWHEALVAWRAQIIISGHNHEATWLPGTEAFPYGQLVGGGPGPRHVATFIEVFADSNNLTFIMRGLDCQPLKEISFRPLV